MPIHYKSISKYSISDTLIVLMWIICLIPIPETPLAEVSYMDKWTHVAMFGTLCIVLWCEHATRIGRLQSLWFYARYFTLIPFFMGGLIELAQAYCTFGTRSGDVADWLADGVGVILGQLIGIPLALWISKQNKG